MSFIMGCQFVNSIKRVEIALEEDDNIQLAENKRIDLKINKEIYDIVIDAQNIILSSENKITVMNLDGNVIKEFVGNDFGMSAMEPMGIALEEQNLYILDKLNGMIIQLDIETEKWETTLIPNFAELTMDGISIAIRNNEKYLSLWSRVKKENKVYKITADNQLTPVIHTFVGYLNNINGQIFATNAYYFTQEDNSISISTGESSIYELDKDDKIVSAYQLESKLAPYKLHSFGEYFISSNMGNASIVKYDISNKRSKVIYIMPHDSIENANIGQLAVMDHNIYLVDNSNHQIVELVYADEQDFDQY